MKEEMKLWVCDSLALQSEWGRENNKALKHYKQVHLPYKEVCVGGEEYEEGLT